MKEDITSLPQLSRNRILSFKIVSFSFLLQILVIETINGRHNPFRLVQWLLAWHLWVCSSSLRSRVRFCWNT